MRSGSTDPIATQDFAARIAQPGCGDVEAPVSGGGFASSRILDAHGEPMPRRWSRPWRRWPGIR
ncbi:MAG: hypothetical protein QM586_13085 [Xenophilus sp.]